MREILLAWERERQPWRGREGEHVIIAAITHQRRSKTRWTPIDHLTFPPLPLHLLLSSIPVHENPTRTIRTHPLFLLSPFLLKLSLLFHFENTPRRDHHTTLPTDCDTSVSVVRQWICSFPNRSLYNWIWGLTGISRQVWHRSGC